MKRLFVIFGVVALSAATTLATLRVADTISSDNLSEATHSTSPFSENAATDALFAASVVPAEYPDLTYAAENAVKAVVNIVATKQVEGRQYFDPFFEFFGYPQGGAQQREAKAGGSGVIISEDGYIVTNNHVIEGATKLRVTLPDGRAFDAKTIGTDPATDVALIKIDASGLPTLPFGSSDDLRLGEWVLAIGYPMELQSTITAGIVSAKARQLGALNNRYGIESFIQTDAAVNPGNSGGGLFDSNGTLIGIVSAKSSVTTGEGLGFVLPIDSIKPIVSDIIQYGYVTGRPTLGFKTADIYCLTVLETGTQKLRCQQGHALSTSEGSRGDSFLDTSSPW